MASFVPNYISTLSKKEIKAFPYTLVTVLLCGCSLFGLAPIHRYCHGSCFHFIDENTEAQRTPCRHIQINGKAKTGASPCLAISFVMNQYNMTWKGPKGRENVHEMCSPRQVFQLERTELVLSIHTHYALLPHYPTSLLSPGMKTSTHSQLSSH